MLTDDILAHPAGRGRYRSEEERRRLLIRDGISWTLVGLIHLLMFYALVISLKQNQERVGRRGAVETMLDLSLLHRNNAPALDVIKPDIQDNDRDISAKPLTVIPPEPVIPQILPSQPSPGDILGAVGNYLACGASSFEYLNRAQQAHCTRVPWQALELPNGTLVLNSLPKLLIQQTSAPPSGSEALTQQMRTNSGCSFLVNTPCLSDMFTGNNSRAPGIPDPH